ncbi:DUF4190 domain-containing protein [Demequina salsinemoris]|uniref:DUF4190 domain-containing protein n=1 Tax=Demequina salsinemoris TaxID=577470 RepID=UPI0007816C1C|nr:DUF4190 domain-containing protein [Demequina salsinemoris]
MSSTPQDPFQSRPEDSGAAQQPQPDAAQQGQQYAMPPYQGQPQNQQYTQQQYPMQQPYAQPPAGPRYGTEKNWMGITALVMGLLGLFTGVTALAGIVFGHMGRAAARRGEADNAGMSLAGLVLSYVIVVAAAIGLIMLFVVVGYLANECGGDNPASWCDPEVLSSLEATAA